MAIIDSEVFYRLFRKQLALCDELSRVNVLGAVEDALQDAESQGVDAAPVVHGKWISWEEADNCIPSPDRYECSVCHDAAPTLANGIDLLSDYCPNCGAKMEVDHETD